MKQTLIWDRDDEGRLIVRMNFPGTPFGVPESDVLLHVPGFGAARLLSAVYREDVYVGKTIELVSLILVDDLDQRD